MRVHIIDTETDTITIVNSKDECQTNKHSLLYNAVVACNDAVAYGAVIAIPERLTKELLGKK